MNLPVKKEASYIEDVKQMHELVDEKDVEMFLVNDRQAIKNSKIKFGKYYHPRTTVADYFKDNKQVDLNANRVEKFLENGVIDNVLFNFLFARGMQLKDGLIDIDRAFTLIKKMNENELDYPEKVPEQPLSQDEKLEIICKFLK